MAKGKFPFEKSKADKEPRGMREGSKREEAMDRRQMTGKRPAGGAVGMPMMRKGGKVPRC